MSGRVRYHLAVSADGYIATPDGGVEWLHQFPAEGNGIEAFVAEMRGIVMGRDTYDATWRFSETWPYGDTPTIVLTSRPLAEGVVKGGTRRVVPPTVQALSGPPAAALEALRSQGVDGDVWLAGGGKVAAQFLDAGLLDRVELAVVPIALGAGLPWASGLRAPHLMRFVEARPYPSGIVWLVYEPQA